MKTITKILVLALVLLSFSCDDVMEENITDDVITINYPQNNQQIESNVVNFNWNEVDGADDYRIQIYSQEQIMVLDSLVNGNSFIHALNPGTYQWRIRGENFAYQTAYTFPTTFTLIGTSDLTNQQVILNSPANNSYTQNTTPTFSWTEIIAADNYVFELINVTTGNNLIHQEQDITGTSYTPEATIIIEDAQYLWRVKATNTGGETAFTSRTFYLDRNAPNQPQNSLPANDSVMTNGTLINLNWIAPNETGTVTSALQYTIQIATDQEFLNIVQTDNLAETSYQYTFTATGNYYWRVKATDLAGNSGNYSSYFKIVIQ